MIYFIYNPDIVIIMLIRILLLLFVFVSLSGTLVQSNEQLKETNTKNQLIKLDKNNFITLRGDITDQLSSDIIRKLNKYSFQELYLYITSPGGSVINGLQIIDQIKVLNERNIKTICIADFAASIAFAIFQSCPTRYITSSSIIMQHQLSLEVKGSLYNLDNYMDFIKLIDDDLYLMQANKLTMNKKDFQNKITNDWWLSGLHIIENKAADQIVNVYCENEVVDMKEEVKYISFLFDVKIIFSKCPLSREPLDIVVNTKINLEKNNKSITEIIDSVLPSKFINKLSNKL